MNNNLNNMDHFWLQMDHPHNLMVISALFEFDAPLDMERLGATIEHRWLAFSRFKMRIVRPLNGLGAPKWEPDPNFDVRSHIHRVALPSPGGKSELNEMMNSLMSIPLDPAKPLWQLYLVEKYGKGCAVFWRIHHCLADGISLMHVLRSITDDSPHAPRPQAAPKPRPVIAESLLKKMGRDLNQLKQFVTTRVASGIETISSRESRQQFTNRLLEMAAILDKQTFMPADPRTVLKGELGVRKTVAWSDPQPLDKLKGLGKELNVSLNDILVTAVTGAIRRYLQRKKQPVDLDLHISMPVNQRSPEADAELGNQFGIVSLALPVGIPDPLERLREVKRRTDKIKRSPEPFLTYHALKAIGGLPFHIARNMAHFFSNKGTAVLSNVPGPQHPIYFAGRKLQNVIFWVPQSGKIGLGISILSYNGQVSVGITADEKRLPNPQLLLKDCHRELEVLLKLKRPKKTSRKKTVVNRSIRAAIPRMPAFQLNSPEWKSEEYTTFEKTLLQHSDARKEPIQ